MVTSRDVIFHETIFPYESIYSPSSNSSVIPTVVPDLSVPDPPTSILDQSHPPPLIDSSSDTTTSVPQPPSRPPPVLDPPAQPLRRSQRPHVPPAALRDYVCHQVTSSPSVSSSSSNSHTGTRYPLCNFLSYHRYSSPHKSFIATIRTDVEPYYL